MNITNSQGPNAGYPSSSLNASEFKLSIPHKNISTINIDATDLYTQLAFRTLIENNEKQQLPYFLAITCDTANKNQAVDGASFLRDYYLHGRKISPITRADISEASFYKIDHLKDQAFTFWCDLAHLKESRDHHAKWINACDPNFDPKLRGAERFYVASTYWTGKESDTGKLPADKSLEQAYFWLRKSTDDGYGGAHLVLAEWFSTGNACVSQSLDETEKHLALALQKLPPNHRIMDELRIAHQHVKRQLDLKV